MASSRHYVSGKRCRRANCGEVPGPEPRVPAKAEWCPGGISYYTRIENSAGYPLARVHYLLCADGSLHGWPSHINFGAVRVKRLGHQQRPQ
jgi:hypothetical protein